MEKITEEINRIKEVMGLRLLTESVGSNFLTDLFKALSKSDNIDQNIVRAGLKGADGIGNLAQVAPMMDAIRRGIKTIDDYPEVNWYKVFDELIGENMPSSSIYKKIFEDVLKERIGKTSITQTLENIGKAATDKNYLAQASQDKETFEKIVNIYKNIADEIDRTFGNDEFGKHLKKKHGVDADNLKYMDELVSGAGKTYELDDFTKQAGAKQFTKDVKRVWAGPGQLTPDAQLAGSELTQTLLGKVKEFENVEFNPSQIKIVDQWVAESVEGAGQLRQRPTYVIELPNNQRILAYISTGTGAPELKKAGEWQVVAGYVTDASGESWYAKTRESISLTQGKNTFLTGMAKWLCANGTFAGTCG